MNKIKLGDLVEDKFTDFKGTVMAIAVYLHGCTQCEVQPRELVNGKLIDAVWIDEPQLKLVQDNHKKKVAPRHGGIRNHPR